MTGTVTYTVTDDLEQQRRDLRDFHLVPSGSHVVLNVGDLARIVVDSWVLDELRLLAQRANVTVQGAVAAIWWWLDVLRGEEIA